LSTVVLFVYGTLAPGQVAWSTLAPHARSTWETSVAGRLYDTGRGYPAAVLGAETGRVAGWCCELEGFSLAGLDEWEGEEYERIVVTAADGTEAFAYHWQAPVTGFRELPAGRWPEIAETEPAADR
jgi:gamma-glutamylcyclotransferase (GGCT)/AIG2-like uncharacterized protein YtfP